MFLGQYQLNFSGRGRVVLPRKFREELGREKELILSRGLDGCIWGFEKKTWQKQSTKQLEEPITDEGARNIRRYLFSAAEDVRIDEQGRFVIPSVLMEYANIAAAVVIIGAGDHFEIWNPSIWKKLINSLTKKTG